MLRLGSHQALAGSADPEPDASALIKTIARDLLTPIQEHRAEYRRSPAKLDELLRAVLLPHVDCMRASRLVLARHWANATPEQRQHFTGSFCKSLMRNYGSVLLDYKLSQLTVMPYSLNPARDRATVRTLVRKSDGDRVHINYALLWTAGGWKTYDVKVEGISYVASFRADYDTEIRAKGLEELLGRLDRAA
jgi:phospholipid transport system substrate-binding protein